MSLDCWDTFMQRARALTKKAAIQDETKSVSFSELADMAYTQAALLEEILDPREKVVFFYADNSALLAAGVLGCWKLGRTVVMLHPSLPFERLIQIVRMGGARPLITTDQLAKLNNINEPLRVFVLQEARCLHPPKTRLAIDTPVEETASILFTSGSTGEPKGVMQSHKTLIQCSANVHQCLGLSSGDTLFCAVPWAFDYGWGLFHLCVLQGVSLIVLPQPNIFSISSTVERFRPTVLGAVPSVFRSLIAANVEVSESVREGVRLIVSSGSAVPSDLLSEILKLFPHAEISLNYGLTETYRSTSLPPSMIFTHPTSVGYAIEGVSIRIVDELGGAVKSGEIGEIVHTGSGMFQSYWRDQAATHRKKRTVMMANGKVSEGVYTGDLGYFGSDMELYIIGRKDRKVKTTDVLVHLDSIERAIISTALVKNAAAFSRPHPILGEQIEAAIVPLKEGTDPSNEVVTILRTKLSRFEIPKRWHLLHALPELPNMKVDYNLLKTMY